MTSAKTRMSPRERVRTALQHQTPDRVPFAWNFGPTPEMTVALERYLASRRLDWQRLRTATDDILQIAPAYIGPELAPHTDIWGIQRRIMSYGTGQYDEIAVYPLAGLSSVTGIDTYPWPDPHAYADAGLREYILSADPTCHLAHKLAIQVCGNPFEIYCWMAGLEEALVNMLAAPELVHAALEHITQFFETRLRLALARCADLIDILYFADDLGGQTGLLLSRQTYRAILQPYHRRLMRLAKQLAPHAHVMFHSDGAVFDILPDLMAAGVEVLEAVQTDANGMQPQQLKQAYGAQLCFHGGISVQALLPYADEQMVFAECQRLTATFGQNGGYIAAPSHAIQVGTPPQNVMAMLRAILGENDYASALACAGLLPKIERSRGLHRCE
ncbi:MAG: hypothetical protein M1546_25250 [Chloroflexi bacterium]|nr:hypothetical protein [Chloroflexota bacterium]